MELTRTSIVRMPSLLNDKSIDDLLVQLQAAFSDPDSRAVVLLGTDDVFCNGLDLGRAVQNNDPTQSLERFAECLRVIRVSSKPVMALVRGQAVGGGVGLAAACDAVLATVDASFGQTELLFGLIPAIVLPYLAQRVVEQKLRWMAMRAEPISAALAQQLGLVDQVCRPEDAYKVLRHWSRQMQRLDPGVIGMWKQLTANVPAVTTGIAIDATLQRLRDPGVQVGLAEFAETGCLPCRTVEQGVT